MRLKATLDIPDYLALDDAETTLEQFLTAFGEYSHSVTVIDVVWASPAEGDDE